jgi:hypothetical protein
MCFGFLERVVKVRSRDRPEGRDRAGAIASRVFHEQKGDFEGAKAPCSDQVLAGLRFLLRDKRGLNESVLSASGSVNKCRGQKWSGIVVTCSCPVHGSAGPGHAKTRDATLNRAMQSTLPLSPLTFVRGNKNRGCDL